MINNKNNKETPPTYGAVSPANPFPDDAKTSSRIARTDSVQPEAPSALPAAHCGPHGPWPASSDIELVIRYSRALKSLLGKRLGATGTGLHERITSVEKRLGAPLVKRLRWIATMRNNVVHVDGFALPSAAEYEAACKKCVEELGQTRALAPTISQSHPETAAERKLQASPLPGHDTSLALSLAIAGSAVLTIIILKLLAWLGFDLTAEWVGVVLPVGLSLGPVIVLWRRRHRLWAARTKRHIVNPTARHASTLADTAAANRQGISSEPIPMAIVAASFTEPTSADSEADNNTGARFFNPSTGLPLTDNCGLDTGGHVVDQNWDYSFGPVDGGSSFNDDFGSV